MRRHRLFWRVYLHGLLLLSIVTVALALATILMSPPRFPSPHAHIAHVAKVSAVILAFLAQSSAQKSVLSAHWANTRATPLRCGGYSVGSGCTCSRTSQINALSQ